MADSATSLFAPDGLRCEYEATPLGTDERFLMSVTIPPNTTATVRIPARSVEGVTEGGGPLRSAKGLGDIRTEDGAVICQAVSGSYNFISRL